MATQPTQPTPEQCAGAILSILVWHFGLLLPGMFCVATAFPLFGSREATAQRISKRECNSRLRVGGLRNFAVANRIA